MKSIVFITCIVFSIQIFSDECKDSEKATISKYGASWQELKDASFYVNIDDRQSLQLADQQAKSYYGPHIPLDNTKCLYGYQTGQIVKIPNANYRTAGGATDNCIFPNGEHGTEKMNRETAQFTVTRFFAGATGKNTSGTLIEGRREYYAEGTLSGIGQGRGSQCHDGQKVILKIGDLNSFQPSIAERIKKWISKKISINPPVAAPQSVK